MLFVLVPDITPRPSGLPPVQLVRGRIVEVLPEVDPSTPNVRIEVVEGIEGGPATGEVVEGFLQGPNGLEARPDFAVGDEVIVNISTDPEAGFVAVNDRYRVPTLALLLGLFAVAVTVVGGWRGVRSLIALALTLAVIVRVVVPLILAGWDPAWVAIVAATGVTVVTFLLTEGARRQTVAAAVGTAISLTLVAVLATLFDSLARFTPLRGSESAGFLLSLGSTEVDLGGLVLAAVIFGALGVLDDVTVTQAATVQELYESDPRVEPPRAGRPGDERGSLAHRGHGQHPRARLRRRVAAAHRPVRRGSARTRRSWCRARWSPSRSCVRWSGASGSSRPCRSRRRSRSGSSAGGSRSSGEGTGIRACARLGLEARKY